ncbi:uncharacterized protein LOC103315329 [Nasonia vitripennis]|uniref:Uncharacterized protein n=1 Tax=Nasonia vitripennis TaxID=7425 RepID=A0A7M7J1D0_NASVI|nr:uncharacterized protein LOC103315329 [Nasonia vitripennis]
MSCGTSEGKSGCPCEIHKRRFNTFDECSSKKVWRQMAKEMRRMKNEKDRESQQGGHAKTEAAPTLALKLWALLYGYGIQIDSLARLYVILWLHFLICMVFRRIKLLKK